MRRVLLLGLAVETLRGVAFLNAALHEAQEVLIAKLTNRASQGKPGAKGAQGQVWFNLAQQQQRRGALPAALRSFRRARRQDPEHRFAALSEALLLVKHQSTASVKRARRLLEDTLSRESSNLGARWNLGLLMAHEGDAAADATLQQAIDTARELGLSPRRLAMMYDSEDYAAQREEEARSFEAWSPRLAPALSALRSLPAEEAWLRRWGAETVTTFGPDTTAAAYGETFFGAWQTVLEHPEMQRLLLRAPSEKPTAVVMGSALGYQCLFFAAAGIPCTGYDLLAESMVRSARNAVAGLDVSVDFEVGDARTAPLLSRFQTPGEPSILWLNDEVWPPELRRVVKLRAAKELAPGSLVVSYGPQDDAEGLLQAAALRVPTSWCRAESLALLKV